LHVKDEGDRIRLVHSSRCQHISAWSGRTDGATDQGYAHWNISDWLGGPFAEAAKLDVEELPAIFMGNKLTKSRKVKALESLRARIQRL